MISPKEGSRVAYTGDGDEHVEVGDVGKIVSNGGTGSHVLWITGARAGEITLVSNDALTPQTRSAVSYDDSLDSGLVTISVKAVYDFGGDVALLNALTDEGHTATFGGLAEETLAYLVARLREDPSVAEVLGSLEPEEGASFVNFTATALLRDAFGAGEDG